MSGLIHFYPGDRSVDLMLVVAVVVTVASSVAWLLSRRLTGNAALRHLVLFSALICCLASPAVVWFCAAAGLTLVSIPILGTDRARIASGASGMEIDREETPLRPVPNAPRVATDLLAPHPSTTTGTNSKVEATRAAVRSPDTPMRSELGAERGGGGQAVRETSIRTV